MIQHQGRMRNSLISFPFLVPLVGSSLFVLSSVVCRFWFWGVVRFFMFARHSFLGWLRCASQSAVSSLVMSPYNKLLKYTAAASGLRGTRYRAPLSKALAIKSNLAIVRSSGEYSASKHGLLRSVNPPCYAGSPRPDGGHFDLSSKTESSVQA